MRRVFIQTSRTARTRGELANMIAGLYFSLETNHTEQ